MSKGSVGPGEGASQQPGGAQQESDSTSRQAILLPNAVLREDASTVFQRSVPQAPGLLDQQGIMNKELIWYLEQKGKAQGCRRRRPFSALNIQDRPEPRSTAGFTSVHSGAPASHKLAPPFSSYSLLTLGMGRGEQQALVMVLIPWSTLLGYAKHIWV